MLNLSKFMGEKQKIKLIYQTVNNKNIKLPLHSWDISNFVKFSMNNVGFQNQEINLIGVLIEGISYQLRLSL